MTHDDELYNIEDDDRLTSDGRLALAMVREHHVTYRHTISAIVALFGEDLVEKFLKQDLEREKVRADIERKSDAAETKPLKDLSDLSKKMRNSYLDSLTELRKTAKCKVNPLHEAKEFNAKRTAKNPCVSKPDQDIQPVSDEALDSEDRGDSITDGQGGSEG